MGARAGPSRRTPADGGGMRRERKSPSIRATLAVCSGCSPSSRMAAMREKGG